MDLEPPSPASDPAGVSGGGLAQLLDRPVVLVGMMGVGKTSVGRRLSAALGWPFVDADEEIEKAAQMSIPEIFETYGEPYFRDGERRVIARLLGASEQTGDHAVLEEAAARGAARPARGAAWHNVIATGGGAFCNPETRALILSRAVAVWLDADLDTLAERTARKDNRPLLRDGNPRETLARLRDERAPAYAEAPVHVVSGNSPHARTLAQVLSGLAGWIERRDAEFPAAPPSDRQTP